MYTTRKPCPHCNKTVDVSDVAMNNAENYGSKSFDLLCNHCNKMIKVFFMRVTTVTDIQLSDAKETSWGETA